MNMAQKSTSIKRERHRHLFQTCILIVTFLLSISLAIHVFTESDPIESRPIETTRRIASDTLDSSNDIVLTEILQNASEIVEQRYSDPIQLKEWKFVYFQHVRKSGGTTFHQLLINNKLNHPWKRVISASADQNTPFRKIKARMIRKKRYLVTVEYFPFYVEEYLKYYQKGELFGDVLLVTLFRNPLDRIFSDLFVQSTWQCHEIKWFAIDRLVKNQKKMEKALINCVRDRYAKFTSNIYTKVFSGVWPYANPNNRLDVKGVDYNPHMNASQIHLEIAKLILSEFDILIVLELWEETKIQLRCNGIMNDTLPHLNAGDIKSEYGIKLDHYPKLKEEMTKLNQYDLELYEFVKEQALQRSQRCRELMGE